MSRLSGIEGLTNTPRDGQYANQAPASEYPTS